MARVRLAALALAALLIASIAFFVHVDSPTGHVVTRARIVTLNITSCNISLQPGFNLISSPCTQFLGMDPDDFLFTVSSLEPTLHAYDASNPSDPWKAYNPALPSWVVQDLTGVTDIEGYWVYVNDSGDIRITSPIISPRTVSLVAGWNLVGYPSFISVGVNESLASAYPLWREVRRWNYSLSAYEIFENGTQTGDFTTIEPFYGYWIYADSAASWVIS